MRAPAESFFEFVGRPLAGWTRPVIALLVVPLLLSYFYPLWQIRMVAPQYPRGLYLDIYSYKLEAGGGGQHIQEINTLNHYIGMKPIDRQALADLDWIPFALGVLGLLALRAAAIGSVRDLIDVTVLTVYVSAAAFGRFVYVLYRYGHELDPKAPVRIEPFMPAVIGKKQIANFTTWSLPQPGSGLLAIFTGGLLALTLWHLWMGYRQARAARAHAAS
ncbi:MAG: hypothetical protein KatS3mg102_2635 [Planctomycetota bacterium]|nr:MAG: hypothetical protein KatS3mg102_2635 [Planctomycetota bacterium]